MAWPCKLRKPEDRQGSWLSDIQKIFRGIWKKQTFVARVVHHAGGCCVVDLTLPDGQLVNSMLIKSEVTSPVSSACPGAVVKPFKQVQTRESETRAAAPTSQVVQGPLLYEHEESHHVARVHISRTSPMVRMIFV
ncbi:uncharacterized protein LOC106013212 [Aplysia californica]|uniref:Uncharacterized protein LOC106013212 n=1 Tax=Aplysia californica TaxID=6500 RepID=A0ABM1AA55_APLCA|nr:uncharacterized protein LOC106013212 [Aplysia californica]